MIIAENVFKSFGETKVLKGITTSFYAGKNNLIIGKSGAGKTVLLKLLVGLLEPTEGRILYGDRDFTAMDKKSKRAIRMEVGMLFQGSALFDSMTVEENIRFPLDMFTNKTKKEKIDRVNYCLDRVEMIGVNDRYPSETSGGMQKRVGIARAIVLEPKYLFWLIQSITYENNITTVINTHDMNSVMGIGDNIALLNEGQIAWQGDKNKVMDTDNTFLENFIFASPFLQRLRSDALANRRS